MGIGMASLVKKQLVAGTEPTTFWSYSSSNAHRVEFERMPNNHLTKYNFTSNKLDCQFWLCVERFERKL